MQNPKSISNSQTSSKPGTVVLDNITSFIRRYLVCDDHQLTVLTLWTASTQCHHHFRTAPYLHLRSPQPFSGKTLCLDLLCDLSYADTVFSGLTPAALIDRLIQGRSLDVLDTRDPHAPFTVLIDDYHHSFGPSERQPLVSLLASGFERSGFFSQGDEDYYLFGPKALAGNSPLPKSLAARCIPIQLRPPKLSERLLRYSPNNTSEPVITLREQLRQWLKQVSPALAQAAKDLPPDLPPALSLGQAKCAETLVHIADVAGGSWPAKIRAALVSVFDLADASPELQMLSDIRAIFRDKNDPEYLATGDLLSQLRTLDSRPWSSWSSKSGQRLAGHLRPFGIVSRRLHFGSEDDFMGYLIKDFQDAWERYLPAPSAPMNSERIKVSSHREDAARVESATCAFAAD